MTPGEFLAVRESYGMTQGEFAAEIGLTGAFADRTIRRYESGSVPIVGPVRRVVELLRLMRAVPKPRKAKR